MAAAAQLFFFRATPPVIDCSLLCSLFLSALLCSRMTALWPIVGGLAVLITGCVGFAGPALDARVDLSVFDAGLARTDRISFPYALAATCLSVVSGFGLLAAAASADRGDDTPLSFSHAFVLDAFLTMPYLACIAGVLAGIRSLSTLLLASSIACISIGVSVRAVAMPVATSVYAAYALVWVDFFVHLAAAASDWRPVATCLLECCSQCLFLWVLRDAHRTGRARTTAMVAVIVSRFTFAGLPWWAPQRV